MKVGKIIWVVGHSGPETAEDSRTHYGIFAPGVTQLFPNGLIINMTSIAGYIGLPFRGIYCASKSALEILTESLRLELIDYNIKVTNIAPGDFKTNIVRRINATTKQMSLISSTKTHIH